MIIRLLCVLVIAIEAAAFAAAGESSDFSRQAVPFLEKHCYDCHGIKVQKSDVTFAKFKDEAEVLKDRALWKDVVNMVTAGEMPPDKRPKPLADDVKAFCATVSAIFEKADRNAKPDAGHVSMRRLNRAEYNNTIRDLLDLDINASEDFPADEVGHGFDNISEVQWITPVHMERYLTAAEMCAQRAVMPVLPKAPNKHLEAKYLEPASRDVSKAKFRPINGEKPDSAILTGPLNSPVQVPDQGEYELKSKLYADVPAGTTVTVALMVCGDKVEKPATDEEAAELFGVAVKNLRPFQILKKVEVKARTQGDAEVIRVKFTQKNSFKRMAMALIKPKDSAAPIPKLLVEWMALEGPLDTRPVFQRKYLSDAPATGSRDEYLRKTLTRLVSRAFRRPAAPGEMNRYLKIATTLPDKTPWEAGVQNALQAILCSPKFLFRPELENRTSGSGSQPLDDYALASRLSYFIWSSMPDDELFALAEKKQLSTNLDAQVRRMLKDPKSRALTENFAMQWLQLRRLVNVNPDPKLFPFAARLKPAMLEETTLFIDAIFREDHSVLDLLDAKFTFLNEPLARLYGIVDTHGNRSKQTPAKPAGEPIVGNKFQRVELSDGERGGILTQASILTVTSNPTRTSPVKRGKWVLDQLLGTPPPPPPPDVPNLDGNKELTGTLRQRLEQHRANAICASCHARMDPIGFAFENYDAIGAFRQKDGDAAVDASGTLPDGQSFDGAAGLKAILKKKKELFTRCLSEKMLTYALGRGLEVYDSRSVDQIVGALAKNDFHVSTLIAEVVKSEPFRMRRGTE